VQGVTDRGRSLDIVA